MILLYWKQILSGAALILLFLYVRNLGYSACEANHLKDTLAAQEQADGRAIALESELADQRTKNRILNDKLRKATKDPAYSCPIPTDGVRLLNEAVSR